MANNVSAPFARHGALSESRQATRYLVPLGRLLFSVIFLLSVPMHFTQAGIGHAAAAGLPMASILVPLAGILELVGAVLLLTGYHARLGAALLALFLIPVTLVMHKFWGISDPMQTQMQQVNFMKNLALLGATCLIMYFGAGPLSLDERAGRS